ncbi:MAG: DUF6198 family protein [Acutalibacteraceae bacterium]
MKKIKVSSELVYLLAIVLMALSVAMISCTNYGLSMIVAPAYLLSVKLGVLSFGQCEYIVQGALFVVFCILMKRIKPAYLFSFVTGLIYGAVLDFWRLVIPHFNPDITAPGSLPVWLNIIYFITGMCMISFSVALFFRTYIYPQVYDFFVKGISERYHINQTKFKIGFDAACLAVSAAMSLILFGGFVGIGIGTVIMALFNGALIGAFGKLIDRCFVTEPSFKKFSRLFELC